MNGPSDQPAWLTVARRDAPLLLSFPHTGVSVPADCAAGLVSLPLARHDADWFIDRLYEFAAGLGATTVHTALSRTVIDVNRDPSGASLYPGQATTGLVPTETFDGRLLYREGSAPSPPEIERRKQLYFRPYHAALEAEIARLRERHPRIVLYDCHSIRSLIPRLFPGELPVLNIGTHSGKSCDPRLQEELAHICAASRWSCVLNGRFTGGWITRSYGRPAQGVHAVQMELAMRGYLADEADPVRWDEEFAAPMQQTLRAVLEACLAFARGRITPPPCHCGLAGELLYMYSNSEAPKNARSSFAARDRASARRARQENRPQQELLRAGGDFASDRGYRGLLSGAAAPRAWRSASDARNPGAAAREAHEALMAAPLWRVEFDRAAVRELRKLGVDGERHVLRYLRRRISGSEDPRRFGHALSGDRKGLWRYRVGDYRIIAAIEDDRFVVLVVAVGHRREVYR
jgi:formiminoglutamase